MRFKPNKKRIKIIIGIIISLCIIVGTFIGVIAYKINLIPSMTFEEMLDYTTFFNNYNNDFYGINEETLNKKVGKISLEDKDYKFNYSNFGFSVVGSVLSKIYDKDYTNLINEFIYNELDLKNTKIFDGSGDMDGYWQWNSDDAYLPAGGVISTITDMMKYVNLQMSDKIPYLSQAHEEIKSISTTTKKYEKMRIRMDY